MIPQNRVYLDGGSAASGDDLNSFLQAVGSLAALRAFVGVDGMSVMLQGSTAIGDSGKGVFFWENGAGFVDDGVNTIVPPANIGAWRRLPSIGYIFNVLDYGAVGDGVTDDTAAVLAAAAAMVDGSVLYFPASPGAYVVNSTIAISKLNVEIRGDGWGVTFIYNGVTDNALFLLSGSNRISVRDMSIQGYKPIASYTEGSAIRFTGAGGQFAVENITCSLQRSGVIFDNAAAADGSVRFCTFGLLTGVAVWFANFGGTGCINNVQAFNSVGSDFATSIGFWIANGDTYVLSNCNIFQMGDAGVRLAPITTGIPAGILRNVFANNVLCDSAQAQGVGWIVSAAFGTEVSRIFFDQCWGCTNGGYGFQFSFVEEVNLNDCIAITNIKHGLFLDASCDGVRVHGGIYASNSLVITNTYDDIHILPGISNFMLDGVTAGQSPPLAPNARFACFIGPGANDNFQVVNCRFASAITGGLSGGWSGSAVILANNLGVDNIVPTVASGVTTDIPINSIVGISGAAAVATINGGDYPRNVRIIPTGAVSFVTGGNIANAYTAAPNVPFWITFNGLQWNIG